MNVTDQRNTLGKGAIIAAPIAIGLWYAVERCAPALHGMDDPVARFVLALKCTCVAVLFCFFLGIEAVSHERLHTAAIDPLAGAESPRMKVNQRYLQHTLEQLMLFVPGLFGLANYRVGDEAMRGVVATTVVWIVARFVFWIGYHRAPRFRSAGLVGMVQSALVLLYVSARFGEELGGWVGAAIVVGLLVIGEGYLVWINRS